jgi:glutamine amidotransferase
VKVQKPFLGICLGMQILFERSEEDDVECLGILPGVVKRIRPNDVNLPVPHMGWNKVQTISNDETVPRLLKGPEYFYFTHSFMAPNGPWVTAACEYGGSIPAIVNKANFYGVQFHPEKSGPAGARLLQEFFKL